MRFKPCNALVAKNFSRTHLMKHMRSAEQPLTLLQARHRVLSMHLFGCGVILASVHWLVFSVSGSHVVSEQILQPMLQIMSAIVVLYLSTRTNRLTACISSLLDSFRIYRNIRYVNDIVTKFASYVINYRACL